MASFHDHFSERAPQYASARPTYPPALAAYLATLPRTAGLAWEVGCGSGQLTRDVAHHFTRVMATDPSFAQILQAPAHQRITYHCALAEASALRNASADLCYAAQAAHWFDIERYYSEVRRVARAGGVVALISYGGTRVSAEVDDVLQHFHSAVLGRYWPPERRHVDAHYETLPFPFEQIATPSFQMQLEWTLDDLVAYVKTWSAVQALQKAQGTEQLDEFIARLRERWGAAQTARKVSWPVVLKAGRT